MGAQEDAKTEVSPPEPEVTTGSAGRRMSLVTVDQGLSSLSNLLVLVVVAHVLEPIDFGRFSLLFLVYAVGQALVRSAVSIPVLVHPDDIRDSARAPLGAACLLGLGVGVLGLIAAGLLGVAGSVGASAVAMLAVCLPFLLVHDVGRYVAFARATPGRAIVLDLLWLALGVGGFVLVDLLDAQKLVWIVLAWAGAGALAATWVFVQYGVPARDDLRLTWLRERWGFVWRSVASSVLGQGVGLIGAAMAAFVSSPVAVAVVRASLLVGRPSATVQAGVGASTAADVARETPEDGGVRSLWRALVVCWVVAILNLILLLVLPDAIGTAILGEVWPLVEPLVLPVGLFGLAAAVHTAIQAVFIGRHEMTSVLWLEFVGACIAVLCLVTGAALADASGAVWGTLIGQSVVAAGWVVAYLRLLRRGKRGKRVKRRRVRFA